MTRFKNLRPVQILISYCRFSIGTICLIATASLSLLLIATWYRQWLQFTTVSAATRQLPPVDRLSETAQQQLAALIREKDARTPIEQKIDSQILYVIKTDRGERFADSVSNLKTDVEIDAGNRAIVEIQGEATAELIKQIESLGGKVIQAFPSLNALRAAIPIQQIESIAAREEVTFIKRATVGVTNSVNNLTSRIKSRQLNHQNSPLSGSVNSQGDVTHQANLARSVFGVDGSGIKIGVLSDSVDFLSASQALGDLGPVTIVTGQSGINRCGAACNQACSGEGTAMLEIVHDLAPGAQLFFATAACSAQTLAQNILELYNRGCDIIVDDYLYPEEAPFQDDGVSQAVNFVTGNGVLYLSSAANFGNFDDGTSKVWEGNFTNGGVISLGGTPVLAHSYGTGQSGPIILNAVLMPAGLVGLAQLFWSDAIGQSANDYDLFVFDPTLSTIISFSTNLQTGAGNPYESAAAIPGAQVLIVLRQGNARYLRLELFSKIGNLYFSTPGWIRGHSATVNALSVAATPAGPATDPSSQFPAIGPFPNPFNNLSNVERFSSDGPRKVFYFADGTPITPGNFLSSGGTTRAKPDLTAADGVSTTLPANSGLNPFFGTSAAAPHAAAIAALVKSVVPTLTAAQLRSVLTGTSIDIEAAGYDRDSGFGIASPVDAILAVAPIVEISATPASRTITQGQSTTYSITLNRSNYSGPFNLTFSGLPSGATASFSPNPTTGSSSTLTINTNAGATTGTFTINLATSTTGIYYTPASVSLTINGACTPPNISSQPSNQTVCSGSPAAFSVIATGTGLSYQWRRNGVNISGANASTFSIPSASAANAGNYDVVVTGTCGTVTSNSAALTVNPATAITSQPISQTRNVGQSVSFSVTAAGSGLTYQWRKNGSSINGANANQLTIASVALTDAGNYDVIVAGNCGTLTSNTAVLTVNTANPGLQYYPLPRPIRLLDTRPGESACATPGAPLTGGASITQQARLTCDGITIPANAQAIVGNATVVNFVPNAAAGFITLYPTGAQQPTVSNLNYLANQVVPNAFTVGLSANGQFNIFASTSTHFIVDVTGYYAPPATAGLYYHPLPTPIRLLDTRSGATACTTPGSPLPGGFSITQAAQLTCNGVTIPSNAQALAGNGTVVNFISGAGFITLYPTGAQQPTVSNLNFLPSQVIPNAFTVGLGTGGQFSIFASSSTHFIVDINGYYSPDAAVDVNGVAGLLYHPLPAPIRLLDTRSGATACSTPGVPLQAGVPLTQQARVTCNSITIPAAAQAIVGNATVVNFLSGPGFVTLYPSNAQQPTVSNLNYLSNQVIPNAFIVGLGNDGAFKIFASSSTHFIADVTGYFAP